MTDQELMTIAAQLALKNMETGDGGPFGAVVARNGQVIATGNNQVLRYNDPTAHAEVVAIRNACQLLNTFQLTDCDLYTSCEPCPMCLGAIYWARPKRIFYANSRYDAANIGFDDEFIYQELNKKFTDRAIPMLHLANEFAAESFRVWHEKQHKIRY